MIRRSKESLELEVSLISRQLESLKTREAEVQRALDEMQRVKSSICAEASALEITKRHLELEMRPINWLPPELLVQIFWRATEPPAIGIDGYTPPDSRSRYPVLALSVCRRWRHITLSTPELWTSISLSSLKDTSGSLQTFLHRSGDVLPLDVASILNSALEEDDHYASSVCFVSQMSEYTPRIRSLIWCSQTVKSVNTVLQWLKSSGRQFSVLRSLDLRLKADANNQSFEGGTALNELVAIAGQLRTLKLQHIPLDIPNRAFAMPNLRSLHIKYLQKPGSRRNGHQSFKMSSLCFLLKSAPLLEEICMADAVPHFDTVLDLNVTDLAWSPGGRVLHSPYIQLPHLRRLEWSWPTRMSMSQLLEYLVLPSLEKLDLCIEKSQVFSDIPDRAANGVLRSVREISYQAVDEDYGCSRSLLRRFLFPSLEVLEIANVDEKDERGAGTRLPSFPHIATIFRDPRASNLTQFTISRFRFSSEHEKCDGLLGYLSALTSLSLESCEGVHHLMKALSHKTPVSFVRIGSLSQTAQTATAGNPKACPRLESITMWACKDVEFSHLLAVVQARNCNRDEAEVEDARSVTLLLSKAQANRRGTETEVTPSPRIIKPLRKIRRSDIPGVSYASSRTASASSMPSGHETPADAFQIRYLRLEEIPNISKEQAYSLLDLGVDDVVWRSR